jgi:hypothetical protein
LPPALPATLMTLRRSHTHMGFLKILFPLEFKQYFLKSLTVPTLSKSLCQKVSAVASRDSRPAEHRCSQGHCLDSRGKLPHSTEVQHRAHWHELGKGTWSLDSPCLSRNARCILPGGDTARQDRTCGPIFSSSLCHSPSLV